MRKIEEHFKKQKLGRVSFADYMSGNVRTAEDMGPLHTTEVALEPLKRFTSFPSLEFEEHDRVREDTGGLLPARDMVYVHGRAEDMGNERDNWFRVTRGSYSKGHGFTTIVCKDTANGRILLERLADLFGSPSIIHKTRDPERGHIAYDILDGEGQERLGDRLFALAQLDRDIVHPKDWEQRLGI
jgi:hypothetical protein